MKKHQLLDNFIRKTTVKQKTYYEKTTIHPIHCTYSDKLQKRGEN